MGQSAIPCAILFYWSQCQTYAAISSIFFKLTIPVETASVFESSKIAGTVSSSVLPKEGIKRRLLMRSYALERKALERDKDWMKGKNTMCATNYGYKINGADNLRKPTINSFYSNTVTKVHKILSFSPRETQTNAWDNCNYVFRSVWLTVRPVMLALPAFGSAALAILFPPKENLSSHRSSSASWQFGQSSGLIFVTSSAQHSRWNWWPHGVTPKPPAASVSANRQIAHSSRTSSSNKFMNLICGLIDRVGRFFISRLNMYVQTVVCSRRQRYHSHFVCSETVARL